MSQGKAVVGVLVLGVTAAFGATAIYPLYFAERRPRPTTAPPVRERSSRRRLNPSSPPPPTPVSVMRAVDFYFFLFVLTPPATLQLVHSSPLASPQPHLRHRQVPNAGRKDYVPVMRDASGSGGGFQRKSMWGNADRAIKSNAGKSQ